MAYQERVVKNFPKYLPTVELPPDLTVTDEDDWEYDTEAYTNGFDLNVYVTNEIQGLSDIITRGMAARAAAEDTAAEDTAATAEAAGSAAGALFAMDVAKEARAKRSVWAKQRNKERNKEIGPEQQAAEKAAEKLVQERKDKLLQAQTASAEKAKQQAAAAAAFAAWPAHVHERAIFILGSDHCRAL